MDTKFPFVFILVLLPSHLLTQEIPIDFLKYYSRKLQSDSGNDWHENTTFGPFRYKHNHENNDSLKVNARFGTFFAKNQKMLYAYGHFTFKKYFHGYLYLSQ